MAAITQELVARSRELTMRAHELEREITGLARVRGPSLLAIPGCRVFSAAKIIGETAGVGHSRAKSAFARWNGSVPIPVWSSNMVRHRLSRGGN